MWKQRYRNEALYPYNGPVGIKPPLATGRKRPKKRRYMPMKMKAA